MKRSTREEEKGVCLTGERHSRQPRCKASAATTDSPTEGGAAVHGCEAGVGGAAVDTHVGCTVHMWDAECTCGMQWTHVQYM